MAKRGRRRVFLGVQWDCGSWDSVPPLCDLILDRVGKRPLVWNFPAPPAESLQRARDWAQKTVGTRLDHDLVAAMGFSGACHPVLSLDELEKEISWGIENPWGTGTFQLFGVRPEILIPRLADVMRPDVVATYGRQGFKKVGIFNGRGVRWFAANGLECFTCSRLSVAESRKMAGSARKRVGVPYREGDVLLLLDISGSVGREELTEALERTAIPWLAPQEAELPLRAAHSTSAESPASEVDGLDWSPFPAPLLRLVVSASSGSVRRKKKKNDEYREALAGLALSAPTVSAAIVRSKNEAGRESITASSAHLVAQMLGEVSLAGNDFDVRLTGGRFTGITKGRRDILPVRPARSYLRVAGRDWVFHTRNSFSFEGDGGTGLREVLAIDSLESAQLSIEYSFCEGCPMLEITADVRWPTLTPGALVEEYAPFVITLKELERAETAIIEAEAPDGSRLSRRADSNGWSLIPGARHHIPVGHGCTLLLCPGPMGAHRWNLASFRVLKNGRRRFLEANPFGGWFPLPATALSERRERSSVLIGIEA